MIKTTMFCKFKEMYDTRPFFAATIVFFVLFLGSFIFFIYFSHGDPHWGDQYFHFAYAELLKIEGIDVVNNFDWIYLSGHGDGGRYAVSLFQIALIPFTFFSDHLFGMKVADIFFMSVSVSLFYYVLRKLKVKYPIFFTALLFLYAYLPVRFLIGRAFVLITTVLLLEVWLAVEKKYKLLFWTCLFHVLWHQATYFMPIGVVGIVELSRYFIEKKIFIKNILATVGGIFFGMAFFPGFPMSIINFIKLIFVIQTGSMASSVAGERSWSGNELFAKNFMQDFATLDLLLALFIFSVFSVIYIYISFKKGQKEKKYSNDKLIGLFSYFIFTIILMWASITISGRVFDFFITAVVLLSALIFTFLSDCIQIKDMLFQKMLKWAVVVFSGILFINTYVTMYAHMNAFDYTPSRKAAEWVAERSENKERVFLRGWTSFTVIFASNQKNVYSMGLEPLALRKYDEDIYWKYYNIYWHNYYCERNIDCKDLLEREMLYLKDQDDSLRIAREKKNSEDIIKFIRDDLNTKYIISDNERFSNTILRSEELIADQFYVKTDKELEGRYMEYWVFELK